MTKKDAVEIILAGRRAAKRTGNEFIVNRDKLCSAGGFSSREMDRIEVAVRNIETMIEHELDHV